MATGVATCYCMHRHLLVFSESPGGSRPSGSNAAAIGSKNIFKIYGGSKVKRQICRSSGELRRVVIRATSQVEASPAKEVVPDTELSITKTSFGTIGLAVGSALLLYGFGAYFTILPGAEWSALMLTYGFPLAIIGMALKYAELKPVPCITYADAYALRKSQATPILEQVRNDVTRYRYGDEQHLEEALKRIFRYGQAGGIQRRNAPVLQSIREEVHQSGKYAVVLVFEAKALQRGDFEERQAKFSSFFGPGVIAEIAAREENIYEVWLIADGGPKAPGIS